MPLNLFVYVRIFTADVYGLFGKLTRTKNTMAQYVYLCIAHGTYILYVNMVTSHTSAKLICVVSKKARTKKLPPLNAHTRSHARNIVFWQTVSENFSCNLYFVFYPTKKSCRKKGHHFSKVPPNARGINDMDPKHYKSDCVFSSRIFSCIGIFRAPKYCVCYNFI